MIKLKTQPGKQSKFIPLVTSSIKRVMEYEHHNMVAAVHIDPQGNVFYHTDMDLINQAHPRFALPFITKTYAKYRVSQK